MNTMKNCALTLALAATAALPACGGVPGEADENTGSVEQAAKAGRPAAPTTYSGRGTVVDASVLGIRTVLSDTGELASSGGAEEASLLEANLPGLLTAQVLHTSTVGQGEASRTEASVADLSLTAGGNTIMAGLLMARATTTCQQTSSAISGGSDILVLNVNGQVIAITGQPNQTVNVLNGKIIINEQSRTQDSRSARFTVTALHVVLPGIADVAISRAEADIECRKAVCPNDRDFVTGGGFITGTPTGARANFGVAGGIRKGSFWGHLSYVDHGLNKKVKATAITGYTVLGPVTRQISGNAEVNGTGGFTFTTDVTDNGEPGTFDMLSLNVSDGYTAGGNLGGGNIQLHKSAACQ